MRTSDTIRGQMLRYLDGTLPEAETQELNAQLEAAPEFRREFAELLRQQVQLAELGAELAEKLVPLPSAPARAWWLRPLAWAAVVAVLGTLGILLWPGAKPESAFHLARVTGEVWVERGDIKLKAVASAALRPGDKVQTAFGAEAEVQSSRDATRLSLLEEAVLTLPATADKTFALEQGTLTAEVAAQPVGKPFIFATPHGEAKVLGTAFRLSADAAATQLAVTEGRVQLSRHTDGAAVEVGARQVAVVTDDVPLSIRPMPVDGDGTGLLGEYFGGRQFEKPPFQRVDSRIQFDWGKDAPVSNVNFDHFQVRWTGTVQPRFSERYNFELVADDGVRLWVDGQLLIDQWEVRSRQTKMRASIELVAGRKHDLKLEYFDASGKAFVSLYWQSENQAREIVPQSQLYPAATK